MALPICLIGVSSLSGYPLMGQMSNIALNMKTNRNKKYSSLSAIIGLKLSSLLAAAAVLLIILILSVSCSPANKKPDKEPAEQAPMANNYQGLRFETTILESSAISNSLPRLVCLGDSVTFGWNIPYKKSYPYLLEEILKEQYPEIMVINSGIGGETIVDGLARLDSSVLYYEPQAVIISFGLNDGFIIKDDIPDQNEGQEELNKTDGLLTDENTYHNNISIDVFADTYSLLIEKLFAKGIIVLIMGPNPIITGSIWENPDIASIQEESYILYNQTAMDIAEDYGIIFVDLQEAFIAGNMDVLLQSDGIHPNEAGLALISEKLSIALESMPLTAGQ